MYYCQLWAVATQSSLSRLKKKCLHGLDGNELFFVLQPPSQIWNMTILLLLYLYFHGTCSDKLHSLVQAFTVQNNHAICTGEYYPHSLFIPLVKRKFCLDDFFPRTTTFWNRLPRGYFPDHNNLNLFKSQVNYYILSATSFITLSGSRALYFCNKLGGYNINNWIFLKFFILYNVYIYWNTGNIRDTYTKQANDKIFIVHLTYEHILNIYNDFKMLFI